MTVTTICLSMPSSSGRKHLKSARTAVLIWPWRVTLKPSVFFANCTTTIGLTTAALAQVCGWTVDAALTALTSGTVNQRMLIVEPTCRGRRESRTDHTSSTAFCCGTRARTVSPTLVVTGKCQQFAIYRKQTIRFVYCFSTTIHQLQSRILHIYK